MQIILLTNTLIFLDSSKTFSELSIYSHVYAPFCFTNSNKLPLNLSNKCLKSLFILFVSFSYQKHVFIRLTFYFCNMQKMAIYSRSSIQNVNNWRFWIRKKNLLLHSIKEQDSDELIEKIYLYTKDLNEIFKNVKMREKTFKLSKAFIEYSNTSNDVYNNINDTIQIGTEKIKLFLMILLLVLTLIKDFKP